MEQRREVSEVFDILYIGPGYRTTLKPGPLHAGELRQTSWCPKFEDMEDESTDLLGSDSGNLFDTTNNIQ